MSKNNKKNRNWKSYTLIFITLVIFLFLWFITKDLGGAFIVFSVLFLGVVLLVAVFGYIFSNMPYWLRFFRGISYEDHIKSLIENGKAQVEEYKTHNAIVFEDMSTGCAAYLLDIGDRKILVLYGQDYGFEPIYDDPEINQDRLFPTEYFSITREIKNERVLDAIPKGNVIKSIIIESPQIENLADFDFNLEDGEVIENVDFDSILNALR